MVVLLLSGIAGTTRPAGAEGNCTPDTRVFAVAAETGHLVEIPSCPDGFGAAVEVDGGDWRGYHATFAMRDGAAAIIYAVTASGELWWRRQTAAGGHLVGATRVGSAVDWAQPVVFGAWAGYLYIGGGQGQKVRTFHHLEWQTGGTTVTEEPYLFGPLRGPLITGMATSFHAAVAIWNGMSFRVWRIHPRNSKIDDDVWYLSGNLPDGVTSVVGDGIWMHAVNAVGAVVLLSQSPPGSPLDPRYGRQDTRPWQAWATSPGHYVRVVVPAWSSDSRSPFVAVPQAACIGCSGGEDGNPWEWQSGGV